MKKLNLNVTSVILYSIGLVLAISLFIEIVVASMVRSLQSVATIACIITAVLLVVYCVCIGFRIAKQNAIEKKQSVSKVETVDVNDYLNIDEH